MTEVVIREWPKAWGEDEPTGVDILWESPDVGGYEWEQLSLVRRNIGVGGEKHYEWAAYVDSGCSCNYAYEYRPEDSDLDWTLSLQTVVNRLHEAVRGSYYLSDQEKAGAKAKLRTTAWAVN